MSAAQCRGARGFLNWSQSDLARESRVSRAAIAAIEGGTRVSYDRTMYDIIRAFLDAGIEFHDSSGTAGDETEYGEGVTFWRYRYDKEYGRVELEPGLVHRGGPYPIPKD
jgi:transcriptional regulator with XRE-family HTH domain